MTPERLEIDVTVIEEALRRLQWLDASVRDGSALELLEVASSAQWVMGSTERAPAVLYVAAHGFALADEEDLVSIFAALRRTLVEG